MSLAPSNLRSRLALGYALAVALTVLVYAAVVYGFTHSSLTEQLDARLQSDFEQAEHGFEVVQDGSLQWKEAEGEDDDDDPGAAEDTAVDPLLTLESSSWAPRDRRNNVERVVIRGNEALRQGQQVRIIE